MTLMNKFRTAFIKLIAGKSVVIVNAEIDHDPEGDFRDSFLVMSDPDTISINSAVWVGVISIKRREVK